MPANLHSGFSALEGVVAMAIGSIVVSGVVLLLSLSQQALFVDRPLAGPGGRTYFTAPSRRADMEARRLHRQLSLDLQEAAAVYVTGALQENPTDLSQAPPLRAGYSAHTVLARPLNHETTAEFRSAHQDLGFNNNDNTGGHAFSLLLVDETESILALAYCFHYSADGWEWFAVEYTSDNASSSMAYGIRFRPQTYAIEVGATANWYRWDPVLGRREQGPSFVVFPDPLLQPNANNSRTSLVGNHTVLSSSAYSYVVDTIQ